MKIRKWLSLVMALAMLASIAAGCGGSAGSGSGASGDTVELTVFIDFDWFWMDDFGGRPVDDEITRLTGVKLNIIKATDPQQLPIMIASNSLPDIVYTDNFGALNNENQCWEMGELLSTYTPDFKPPVEQTASATNADGKYYYLVNFWQNADDWDDPHFLPGVGNKGFIYRKDILDELGLPVPATLADLEKVLAAVQKNYPDMAPLAVGPEGTVFDMFVNQSVLQPGTTDLVEQSDGSWQYYASTDAFYEGIRKVYSYAQSGYLRANMFTLKYDQYIAEAQQGFVFMWADDAANAALYNTALADSGIEGAYTEMLPRTFYDNPEPVIETASGWCGTFVTKNCSNPEAAAKFLEWCATDEAGRLVGWGLENEHYTVDSSGYPVLSKEIAESWNRDYDATVRETGIGCWFFGTRGWYESVRTYDPVSNPELTEWLLEFKETVVVRPELAGLRPESGTDAAAWQAQLHALVDTYYAQIIFAKNDAEFESLYQEFQSMIAAQGGREYEAWGDARWEEIRQSLGL